MDRVADGTLDPDRVRVALARLAQRWPRDYPGLEALLEHI